MVTFSPDASDVFRDHNTKFVPSSGAYNPAKSYIRTYLKQMEEIVSALATADNFQGAWDASTGSFPSGAQKGYSWIVSTPGTVGGKYFGEGDQLVALVNGASTSTYAGNWVVIPAWSSGVVPAVDEGAGTANAIQITTAKPVNDDTIVVFSLFEDTTSSPVTVSINGGAALTLKSNRGNNASALTAGMEVWGRIRSSDNTFRLLNDQDVSALVGQAEEALAEFRQSYLGAKASDPSVDNEGNALIEGALYWNSVDGNMRVYHSSAWEDFGSVADGSVTNAKLADMATATIKGRATAGTGVPEDLTGDQVAAIVDPDELVLTGEGLRLTYHKARSAWHVKAFGTSLTEVGAGNAAVDTAALQAAMLTDDIIDITGTVLTIDDTITTEVESKTIFATGASHRPGGGYTGDSGITIADDALPVLFQIGHDNFEASDFFIRGSATNETTQAFSFIRTVDTYRDIDCRLIGMGVNRLGSVAYHRGRGIEVSGGTFSDIHEGAFVLDQPATWTPRGSASIDGADTGTRANRFINNRAHAMFSPFVKNAGAYAQNIGGIEINGLIADIGCDQGLIYGVMIDLMAQNIQCRYSVQGGSRLFELLPGSRKVNLTNFNAVGYIGASGNRLSNHAMRMTSSAALPIKDVFINVGTIGPTLQAGVNLLGDGAFDNIVFSNILWDRIGQDGGARSPIQIGSSVTSSMIKLIGTHARDNFTSQPFLSAFNTPANNTLYRELTATIDGSFSAWATAGVVQPPY